MLVRSSAETTKHSQGAQASMGVRVKQGREVQGEFSGGLNVTGSECVCGQ